MSSPSRRHLLEYGAAVVGSLLCCVPGCLSRRGAESTPADTETPMTADRSPVTAASTPTLTRTPTPTWADRIAVSLHNATAARATVRLAVSEGDTRLTDTVREVPPDGTALVDSRIRETGTYEFLVAVDGGPSDTATFPIDSYDLRVGSNVVATVRTDAVRFLIEE